MGSFKDLQSFLIGISNNNNRSSRILCIGEAGEVGRALFYRKNDGNPVSFSFYFYGF